MSEDNYPSFLKPNGGYCDYYFSNIFRNTQLGNITGYSPVLNHDMRLDQSRASVSISWIIIFSIHIGRLSSRLVPSP